MFLENVPLGAPDPIFGLTAAFRADPRPDKIDLMVGVYKNEQLQSELLPSVIKAKEKMRQEDLSADYLPIDGLPEFLHLLGRVCFGETLWAQIEERVYATQTPGGTGALRIGGEFIRQEVNERIALSQPTWPNHPAIFERAGCQIYFYSYYNQKKHGFDWEAMKKDLLELPPKSSVLLHTVCHNPTGCDPNFEEWEEISALCKKRNLFPFFDFAYQGFGEGIQADRIPLEIFFRDGHEMVIAYSCSKNLSLYCQRVGALFVVTEKGETKKKVASQIKRIIRALYSNPPAHGAKLAHYVLKNDREQWELELAGMQKRMAKMRKLLADELLKKTDRFEFLRGHKGMFSYADLSKNQVKEMIERYAVYMVESGRISVAGLNEKNIKQVAEAMVSVSQ